MKFVLSTISNYLENDTFGKEEGAENEHIFVEQMFAYRV